MYLRPQLPLTAAAGLVCTPGMAAGTTRPGSGESAGRGRDDKRPGRGDNRPTLGGNRPARDGDAPGTGGKGSGASSDGPDPGGPGTRRVALPTAPLGGALKKKHVAWRMLLTTHALLLRRTEASLQAAGMIPFDWHDVLMALHEAPDGRLRPTDLAEAVLLSRAGISRRVDRMTHAGLVRRQRHPADKRSVFLSLTPKGRRTLHDFWPVYRAIIEECFTPALSASEAETLSAAFHRIVRRHGSESHQNIYPGSITEEP